MAPWPFRGSFPPSAFSCFATNTCTVCFCRMEVNVGVTLQDAPVKRRVPEIPFETPASGSLMRMDQVYHTSNGLKY